MIIYGGKFHVWWEEQQNSNSLPLYAIPLLQSFIIYPSWHITLIILLWRRVPLLPAAQVSASNHPAITMQMPKLKDWMHQYEDGSKQAQESPVKDQIDIEIIQKFCIVWWENVCNFYSILSTFIDTS